MRIPAKSVFLRCFSADEWGQEGKPRKLDVLSSVSLEEGKEIMMTVK